MITDEQKHALDCIALARGDRTLAGFYYGLIKEAVEAYLKERAEFKIDTIPFRVWKSAPALVNWKRGV